MGVWLYRWIPRWMHWLASVLLVTEGVWMTRQAVQSGLAEMRTVGLTMIGAGVLVLLMTQGFSRVGTGPLLLQSVSALVMTVAFALLVSRGIAVADSAHLGSGAEAVMTWGMFARSVETGDDALAAGILTPRVEAEMFGEESSDVAATLHEALGSGWWRFRPVRVTADLIVLARKDGAGVVLSREPEGWRVSRLVYVRTEQRSERYETDSVVHTTKYLPRGVRVWVVPPRPGLRDVTYRVTYGNGRETTRERLAESVTTTAGAGVCWVGKGRPVPKRRLISRYQVGARGHGHRSAGSRSSVGCSETGVVTWHASGHARTYRFIVLRASGATVHDPFRYAAGDWTAKWKGPHAEGVEVLVLVVDDRPAAWRSVRFTR